MELALRHSREGELLSVYCASKFGYGILGRPALSGEGVEAVPGGADLLFEAEVLESKAVPHGGSVPFADTWAYLQQRKQASNRCVRYTHSKVVSYN